MANENKEIGDIVKKCKILLLDIEGTTTSISFVKDKLFPYAEQNVKQFLDSQWEAADVKEAVAALRKLAIQDKGDSVEGVVEIPGEDASKEDQIEGLVNNVKWQMAADRKAGPLKLLQGLIWKQGYDSGDIKGHVYDDVSPALESWRSTDDQKVYIYSSGSVEAQKLLFAQSLAGDLLKYIDGHFDTAVGVKQEPGSYTNIVEKIGCKADEILFLTDIVKEAEAARSAGLQAALVSREGNAPLPADAAFPVLRSLAGLAVSHKRKPDCQEMDTPAAKILKTDTENGDKSPAETAQPETTTAEIAEPVEPAKPAKMEVEETDIPKETETKKAPEVKEQIVVEELDSNEASSVASVVDVEPAAVEHPAEEIEEKTEQKETEKETEEIKEKNDAPVPEETPVVMEVEEVTDDKPLLDVAEIVEDVVPIVEEPENGEDMDKLKNVGEVLEKECDEILSKVNSVTNLENITVKPMLNPIAEETMETDSGDTNDIVDRILDTEMDLEMKQCSDIDPSTVTEISEEEKTEVVVKNGVNESSPTEKEEKVIEEKEIAEKEEMVSEEKDEDKQEAVTEEKNVAETKKMDTENKEIVSEIKEVVEEKKENGTEKDEIITEKDEIVTEKDEMVTQKEETVVENTVEKVVDSSPMEAEPQDKPVDEAQNKESQVDVSSEAPEADTEQKTQEKSSVEAMTEEIKSTDVETEPAKLEEAPVEDEKPTESAQETKVETEEPQRNGTAANGNGTDVSMNGDTSKEEEISSRLSDGAVENGKVNGSNGDSMDGEKGQGDCKVEPELNDIKVKSVAMDEPRTDPIEQPTEA